MVGLDDLTVEQIAALAAIVRGGRDPRKSLAWIAEEDLLDGGHAGCVVNELVGLELAVRWAMPTLAAVTLTPYGAWLMEVHILERMTIVGEELEEDPYWAELDKEALPLHLPKRRHEIRWPWMDEVPDPTTTKRQVLEDEEGEPVKIMGQVVPIDRRLAKKTAKAEGRRAG